MILNALPARHSDHASIHDQIDDLHMRTTNYYGALPHFRLAYKLKHQRFSVDHPELGITWNHFGNYYKAIGDHQIEHSNRFDHQWFLRRSSPLGGTNL